MKTNDNKPGSQPSAQGANHSSVARSPEKRAPMAVEHPQMRDTPEAGLHASNVPPKPTMRYPLATRAKKPSADWMPFFSSLIDTVAVLVDVRHKSLLRIAENNPNVKRNGNFELRVMSKFSKKITARVLSRHDRETLYIEASIPKFMTGQNIVGQENLFDPCIAMILEVLKRAGIRIAGDEYLAICGGAYTMVRIDYTVHCDCGTAERAAAVMAAIRFLNSAKARESSAYANKTVYVNQHSSRWTLRFYRKDLEISLKNRQLPKTVYGREFLIEAVQNCVRIEHVLRAPELRRLELSDPFAWNVDEARQRMQVWIDRFSNLGGVVPNVENIESLSNVNQLKLRAWLQGDLSAFTRAPSTFSASRKAILAATGIDVRGEPSVELQRSAMRCIRDVFRQGIGFKSHIKKWAALCAGLHDQFAD
jgi:hypothetical protein